MGKSRRRTARACLMAGVSLATIAFGSSAMAQTIDTVSSWNGTTFISQWGVPNTATYGQTITGTNLNSKLNSFTFQLAQEAGTPPNYQAFVYQWDSANRRITGPALFTSAPSVAPTTANANTYAPVTFATGGYPADQWPAIRAVLHHLVAGERRKRPVSLRGAHQ